MFSFGRNPYNGGSVRHVADHHSTGPHNGFPANGYVIQDRASYTDEGTSAYFRVASHGDLRADIDIVFSQTVVFDHCVGVYNAADSHIGIDIDDGTCQYGAATVSYTHLDVYKRQVWGSALRMLLSLNLYVPTEGFSYLFLC